MSPSKSLRVLTTSSIWTPNIRSTKCTRLSPSWYNNKGSTVILCNTN
ncbi:hypothetical protein J007_03999 [Cryptococcus neoformans]|nr:hypothetical protein C356_04058 [Cryptococcus neoformans var. grubii c45]OXB36221.1 hypothetical protein J007_03999 [Cryptococcus neoformans var. grubii]OXC60382.1 hypothetical protein C358_04096 [Cryptococcus neoformans var. grubii MW-RSA852]